MLLKKCGQCSVIRLLVETCSNVFERFANIRRRGIKTVGFYLITCHFHFFQGGGVGIIINVKPGVTFHQACRESGGDLCCNYGTYRGLIAP